LAIDFLSESAEFWLRARTGEPLRWSTRLHGDFGDLLVRYHQEDGSAAWYSLSRPGEIEIRIGAAFDHKTGRRLVQAELVSPAAVAEFSFGQFQQSSWIDAALRLCNDTGELSLRGRGSYNRNEGFHYQLLIEMGLTF
jgi:hypothetical protein